MSDGLHPSIIDQAVALLALNFCAIVRIELVDHLTEIRLENAANFAAGRTCCATQNHCEASELMEEAWKMTFGVPSKIATDEELYIIQEVPERRQGLELAHIHAVLDAETDMKTAAWNMAKHSGFRLGEA